MVSGSSTTHDERTLEAALDRALADNHLHVGFKDAIRRLVFDDNDSWRVCCGSACEPCVLPMGRAVDQVRRLIGWRGGD